MKLTKDNIAEIAVMVFDGKTSAQIAEHFNISIPTVNYHRMKFKKNGTKLQKSKNIKSSVKRSLETNTFEKSISIEEHPTQKIKSKIMDITLFVNGIAVTIDKKAKHVHVYPTHLEIKF